MTQLAIPDLNRRFMVSMQSKQLNPIIVNEKGILYGVNIPIPQDINSSKKNLFQILLMKKKEPLTYCHSPKSI